MDRERKDELPQMQVEFIDQICVPLYTSLSDRLDKNIFFLRILLIFWLIF